MAIADSIKFVIEVDSETGQAKLRAFNKELDKTEQQAGKTSQGLGALWTAFKASAVVAASLYTLKKAFDFAEAGAHVEKMQFAFGQMTAGLGADTEKILADLKHLSGGTINELALMTQASRAATLGIPIDKVADMMKIARAAAAAMGQDTQYMFESIVLGTARQSRLILDNLGIIIQEEKVYADETKRLGHALSEAEKRQAFLNAVLTSGNLIVQAMGDTSALASEKIDRMKTSWKDLSDAVAKGLMPVVIPGIEGTANIISRMTMEWNALMEAMGQKMPGTDSISKLNEKLEETRGWISYYTQAIEKARGTSWWGITFLEKLTEANIAKFEGKLRELAQQELSLRKLLESAAFVGPPKPLGGTMDTGMIKVVEAIKTDPFATQRANWEAVTKYMTSYYEKMATYIKGASRIRMEEAERFYADLKMRNDEWNASYDALIQQQQAMLQQFAQPFVSAIGRMVSGLFQGVRAFKNMRDLMRSILADIAQMIIQLLAMKAIMAAFNALGMGGLFGVGGSLGGLLGRPSAAPPFPGGGTPSSSPSFAPISSINRTINIHFHQPVADQREFRRLVYRALGEAGMA